jgi:hypothetical protein
MTPIVRLGPERPLARHESDELFAIAAILPRSKSCKARGAPFVEAHIFPMALIENTRCAFATYNEKSI